MATTPTTQPKHQCHQCGATRIDEDLTIEADGSRLCGDCWLKAGVESGKFKVGKRSGEKI